MHDRGISVEDIGAGLLLYNKDTESAMHAHTINMD